MCNIYLYYGEGAGKSTGALGLALRALGHEQNVVIIQFLKWNRDTGEYLFAHNYQNIKETAGVDKYYGNIEILQFSSTEWIGVATLTDKDRDACKNGLATAYIKGKENTTNLLILDEVNYAISVGMLDETDVIQMIQKLKNDNPKLNIVLTGRGASKALIKLADFVNEIKEIKSKGLICEEGIQY
jgi:cob(I)alamin adenosyltransferase